MGAWHFGVLSDGKPPTPIKFLLLGGGGWVFLEGGGGGGSANFIFMGVGIFFEKWYFLRLFSNLEVIL